MHISYLSCLQILKEKYENHPEVSTTKIELKRVQDELEQYRNFYDMGEREVLLEEIQDLRSQLQFYIDSSSTASRKQNPLLQLTYSCEPSSAPPLSAIPESTEEGPVEKLEQERIRWTEAESRWISLCEELRIELEASRSLAEKRKQELETERRCTEELQEAMQMAIEGHARILELYADLEEKHIQLLARHRRIQEGIEDVKKAAAKAGVRGAESKFINALAAEISALRVEREKERRYFRDENKGLQAQLRDTAEAVQAAGELLVRLKEAEEAVAAAQVSLCWPFVLMRYPFGLLRFMLNKICLDANVFLHKFFYAMIVYLTWQYPYHKHDISFFISISKLQTYLVGLNPSSHLHYTLTHHTSSSFLTDKLYIFFVSNSISLKNIEGCNLRIEEVYKRTP